jgi:tetratricopeptide (TPR) repeat protein
MHRSVLLGLLLLGFTVLSPAAIHAQDVKTQARHHFEKGRNLYDAGDFSAALVEFKAAFGLKDDPAFLFNMGQCHSKLGDDTAAAHAFRSYLRRNPDAPNRVQVESRIAEIEERRRKADTTASPQAKDANDAPTVLPAEPAVTSTTPAGLDLVAQPTSATPEATPFLKSWWFWTSVGVVVVAGVTTAILLSRGSTQNGCDGESLACWSL